RFGGPVQDERFAEPPLKIAGDADRWNHREGNDDYTQPGNLFRLMNPEQRQALFNNIAEAMQGVPRGIIERQLAHFDKADPAYGAGVRAALDAPDSEGAKAISTQEQPPATPSGD